MMIKFSSSEKILDNLYREFFYFDFWFSSKFLVEQLAIHLLLFGALAGFLTFPLQLIHLPPFPFRMFSLVIYLGGLTGRVQACFPRRVSGAYEQCFLSISLIHSLRKLEIFDSDF